MLDQSFLIKIACSLFIGLVIGADREYKSKNAGLRTVIFISLGSTIYAILSTNLNSSTPDRILANIVTGVGFLCAGVIFKDENHINGLTTAAVIWVTSALGAAVGVGKYELGFLGLGIVMLVLRAFIPLQVFIDKQSQTKLYKLVCNNDEGVLAKYENIFKQYNLKPHLGKQNYHAGITRCYWEVQGSMKDHTACLKELLKDNSIHEIEC